MSIVIGIDPGPTCSAWVKLTDIGRVIAFNKQEQNELLLEMLRALSGQVTVAIERFNYQGFGVNVGRETFGTCEWVGRFQEAARACSPVLLYRREIQIAVCGSTRANDSAIAFALRELYGGQKASVGTKKAPGPLHGISSHAWQALAVAVAYLQKENPVWRPEIKDESNVSI